jgi:crotonobetainyl-CoA:carnitine CoA-transferase CaiB-like acyl-CoA transferase
MSFSEHKSQPNGLHKNEPPLHGIRVLDLSTVVAGPFSSMILADLGADVIKVERVDGGDDSRGMGPQSGGWGAMFVPLNRGKRSLAMDITKPAGREAVLRLAEKSDVFIENFRGGKAEALGFDEKAIRARNSRIIYASMSAFGRNGPDRLKPGYDGLIQGRTGIISITGNDANTTSRAGVSLIDMSAGMWLSMGVLAALYERQRTGNGQRVDTSLLHTGVMLMAYHLLYRQFAGENPTPQGSGHASFAPYGAFDTSDGKIMIGVSNDRVFRRLCTAMQRPEWACDPRYLKNVLRVQNRAVLDEELQAQFLSNSTGHWTEVLDNHDVPVSPIQNAEQVLHDPQITATGQLQEISLPVKNGSAGESIHAAIPRLPVGLSVNAPGIAGRPPILGEHSADILRSAGYTDHDIAELLSSELCVSGRAGE